MCRCRRSTGPSRAELEAVGLEREILAVDAASSHAQERVETSTATLRSLWWGLVAWPPIVAVLLGVAFKLGFAKLLMAHWMAATAAVVLPLIAVLALQRYHRARLAYSQRRVQASREQKVVLLKRVKVELPMKQALELLSRHDPGGDHKELIQLPPEHVAEVEGLKADKANLSKIVDTVLSRLLSDEAVSAAVLESLGPAVAADGDDATAADVNDSAGGAAGGAGASASVPATPAAAGRGGAPGTAYKTPAAKSTVRGAGAGAATQGGAKTPWTASRTGAGAGAPSTARRGAGGAGAGAGDASAAKSLLSHLLPPESVDLLLQKHAKDLPACTPLLNRARRGGAAAADDDDAAGGGAGGRGTFPAVGALGDWIVKHVVAEEGADGESPAPAAAAAGQGRVAAGPAPFASPVPAPGLASAAAANRRGSAPDAAQAQLAAAAAAVAAAIDSAATETAPEDASEDKGGDAGAAAVDAPAAAAAAAAASKDSTAAGLRRRKFAAPKASAAADAEDE